MGVFDSPSTSTLEYIVKGDTRYWPPEALEAVARGVEAVLVDAAFEDHEGGADGNVA